MKDVRSITSRWSAASGGFGDLRVDSGDDVMLPGYARWAYGGHQRSPRQRQSLGVERPAAWQGQSMLAPAHKTGEDYDYAAISASHENGAEVTGLAYRS
jgi:hypothetical protein